MRRPRRAPPEGAHDASSAQFHVFAATCSGCARLSGEIDLPLLHVDVAVDVADALRALNAKEHGAGFRVDRMFQPILFDGGWSDWRMLDQSPGRWPNTHERPHGLRVVEGRIAVSLPVGVTLADLRGHLRGALAHLRVHDVASGMAYMESRSDECLPYVVHPRYTPGSATRDFRGARRVDDIYVLDLVAAPWRLFWAAVSARLAAIEGVGP